MKKRMNPGFCSIKYGAKNGIATLGKNEKFHYPADSLPLFFILSVQYIEANICRNNNKAIDGPEKGLDSSSANYFDEVYFVTALVPSDTACFASSPGSRRRTAV